MRSFHHRAGELHVVPQGIGHLFVEGDVNGDGHADFRIDVHGANTLADGDFISLRWVGGCSWSYSCRASTGMARD
jgi:hypothetical protein